MIYRILLFAFLASAVASCDNHDHENEAEHAHESGGEHAHDESEEHEEIKVQYTAYTNSFELFAEADAFVLSEQANVLSHFSKLPSFKALDSGSVTIRLKINGKEVKQTLKKPTRKGIYSFDITPEEAGTGTLTFQIDTSIISISNAVVYANHEQAHGLAHTEEPSKVNTVVFTKEQSWKIDFRTEMPKRHAFGRVIRTVAKVEPDYGKEVIISAKTSGIIVFSNFNLLEGSNVRSGQKLFAITSGGMSENNISVKLAEAKSNFENAKADYDRHTELAKDKIISEKELLAAKNLYENAKIVYKNLTDNFSATGQSITGPISGFVKQIFVSNGEYVEAGQPLITISQNQTLLLKAYVQQKYLTALPSINSANIKTLYDNKSYTLEELNGKVVSYGKSVSDDNYLLPVNIKIDNKGSFVQGSFVEIYLKTLTNSQALTVPNTALLEEQGNYFVCVQIHPELFEKREVKIGVTDGIRTEIVSGLQATERIISKGAVFVKLAQSTGALDAHSGHVH